MIMNKDRADVSIYWKVLCKRKGLILGGTCFCMGVTLLLSFLLPPVYESYLTLKVGELYPPPEENIKLEAMVIEEPMSVVEIVQSEDFMDRARKDLGLKVPLRKMEDRLTVGQVVELTRFQRTESRLVKVSYEDIVPQTTVDILNSLAGQLIADHTVEYDSSIKMLKDRIANNKEKIRSAQKLVAREEAYQKGIEEELKKVNVNIREYEEQLKGLDFARTERTEALFLKSALNSIKEQVIELQKEYNEANLAVGEADEKIQLYKDQIANLSNLIDLTKNTTIRTEAVIPEEPIRPQKLLNTIVAGGLALILLTVFALLREYIKTPR